MSGPAKVFGEFLAVSLELLHQKCKFLQAKTCRSYQIDDSVSCCVNQACRCHTRKLSRTKCTILSELNSNRSVDSNFPGLGTQDTGHVILCSCSRTSQAYSKYVSIQKVCEDSLEARTDGKVCQFSEGYQQL